MAPWTRATEVLGTFLATALADAALAAFHTQQGHLL
jgi:hypothetical protein